MPPLENQRHELFAQGLAAGKPAVRAYVDAGYEESSAEGNAHRLTENEGIRARVVELQGEAAKKVALSKSWVIEKLIEVHDKAMQGNPVLDRYGNPTGDYIQNFSGANRALELLGKEIGMFVDRKHVEMNVNPWTEILEIVNRSREHTDDSGRVH